MLPFGDEPVDLWVSRGRFTFEPQDDASELQPRDAFALPGLVDAHVHIALGGRRAGLPAGSLELVNEQRRRQREQGALLLRDMGAILESGDDRAATLRVEWDDGLPRVVACGELLAPADVFTGGQRPTAPDELAEAGLAQVRRGASWVKVVLDNFPQVQRAPLRGLEPLNYDEETLRALVGAAHGVGARVAVHTFTPEGAEACVAAGVDSIEHGWGVDEPLLERMATAGIAWTPTLCIDDAMVRAASGDGERPEVATWIRETIERLGALLRGARARGVTVLAGSDSLAPAATEIRRLFEAGMEPADALAAGSTVARRYLGLPGIEEGAAADLVLYESDPRDSPELLDQPSLTMVGGVIHERGDGLGRTA